MFKIQNVTLSTTEERFITPTYNIVPNVTVPPFVNLIANLDPVRQITNPINITGTIVDGILLSGDLITLIDCSINLTNAVILHAIINSNTTLSDVTLTTTCGKTFTNLEIENAEITNATIINVSN